MARDWEDGTIEIGGGLEIDLGGTILKDQKALDYLESLRMSKQSPYMGEDLIGLPEDEILRRLKALEEQVAFLVAAMREED